MTVVENKIFLNNITVIIIRQILKNMTVKNIQIFKKFVKPLIMLQGH
jgi:hypothetical protein